MTGSEGNGAHRHPDAVADPEGLPEGEAAHPPLVRRHAEGRTRYRIEDGKVRSRDVAGDGTPAALLAAILSEFGSPTWTAWSARSGTPRWTAALKLLLVAAGCDATRAGVRGLRQADVPACSDGDVLPDPAEANQAIVA